MKKTRITALFLTVVLLFSLGACKSKGPKEPNGHNMGVWTAETAPTYKKKGTLVRRCTDEGCDYSESFRLKASSGLEYEEVDGTLLVSDAGSFKGSFLYIASFTPDGRKVDGIAMNAFLGNEKLNYVYVEDGIKQLGGYAFAACPSLKSAALPLSCSFFDVGMFLNCSALSVVRLPENLTELPESSFDGCVSLKSLDLPDSVRILGHSALNLCTSLENIHLPEGLTEIGSNCFDSCTSLKSVSLPKSLKIIGSHAFTECRSLDEMVLSMPLDLLSGFAFTNCTGLSKVFLSKDIVTIDAPDGFSPFYGCARELLLVTDAPSKPEGWSENFSVYLPASAEVDSENKENLFLAVRYGSSKLD